MSPEAFLIAIAVVVVLGVGAQWLAWRFRLPSILLLLICGFVAGPVTGFIDPTLLQGNWLFPFVSLSIGIILFEGGLSLRLDELRDVGHVVRNLITVGVAFTGITAAIGAHYLVGFGWPVSVVMGAILTVTGPTVIIPLLRHVRPSGRVGTAAKWEGITIDPIGAILAVLVLEAVILLNEPAAAGHAAEGFTAVVGPLLEVLLLEIVVGLGVSVAGAFFLIVLIRRRLIPDWLQNPMALMTVVAVFALANALQDEAGLLSTTLMGIFMANQRYVSVHKIIEFKEDLRVLLISVLFIVLSARLELSALAYISVGSLLFLGLLMLVIRPLAVMLSSIGTKLTWKEQTFLAWLAPRGIVAAAVASLFSFRLEEYFPEDAARMVPVIFLVIVGTVAVYGLSISPLARRLGLAQPNPQGVLFVGAHAWARQLARVISDLGFGVLMLDSNSTNVARARQEGLTAKRGNVLSEDVVDDLDLSSIGKLVALTPNDEVNSLAALRFSEIFESTGVYQLNARVGNLRAGEGELPLHLRGRPLWGKGATFASLAERFDQGAEIKTFELSEDDDYASLQRRYDDDLVPLALVNADGELRLFTDDQTLTPESDDHVVVLVPSVAHRQRQVGQAPFEQLVARSEVIDLDGSISYEKLVAQAAASLARELSTDVEGLAQALQEGSRYGAAPIAGGVALPHIRLRGIDQSALLLARSRAGIRPTQDDLEASETVHAFFFLVSPEENPEMHLRILANIAGCIDQKDFLEEWLAADDERELKETLLHHDRFLSLFLSAKNTTSGFIGKKVGQIELPPGNSIALIQRGDDFDVPNAETVLQEGDCITIIGDPAGVHRLYKRYRDSDPKTRDD